jgi:hypothetical protein
VTIHDERTAEGVEHLQAAALELIAAARVFLDATEELVHDRELAGDVVASIASLAGAVAPGDLFGRRRRSARRRSSTAAGPTDIDLDDDELDGADEAEDHDDGDRRGQRIGKRRSDGSGVQHIDIA